MRRRNPIPKSWGKTPILFTFQDSPNENLDGEDLRLANLEGTNLSGSSFRNANLEGANLASCDLSDCDFTGANLDGADLAFAKVDGAIFKDCSVEGAVLFDLIKIFTVSVFEPINFEKIAGYIDYSYDNSIAPDVDVPETIKALATTPSPVVRAQFKDLLYSYFDLPELPEVHMTLTFHETSKKSAAVKYYSYPLRKDPEGYLVNPNDQTTIWTHSSTADIETFDMEDFTVSAGSGMYNELFGRQVATYFAGRTEPFTNWTRLDPNALVLYTVKIKVGDGCRIFDARDLFSSVPAWVTEEMDRALQYTADQDMEGHLSVFTPYSGADGSLSRSAGQYLESGDLGETLNLWRSRFSKEDFHFSYKEFWHEVSPFDAHCETWLEFALGLFGLDFFIIQHVLWKDPTNFPLINYGPIIGWLEREFTYNGLSPEEDPINLAIVHRRTDEIPSLDVKCLKQTEVNIISADPDYEYGG
ncbi:MAG: pentapeptide repeat-containing protein [Candidatus Thorarchaeota archaeon]|jgi:uncharacterized protein YjbI with pentapeptide repeats